MHDYSAFSANLKRIRKDKKLSSEQLADKINRSYKSVSKYENGYLPSVETLIVMCNTLEVSFDDLLGIYLDKEFVASDNELQDTFHLMTKLKPHERNLVHDYIQMLIDNRDRFTPK